MSWLFDDVYEYRAQAQAVLERVKAARRKLKIRIERLDESTWTERNLNPQPFKSPETMQSVTRDAAEQAIALYRTAKSVNLESETQMREAERVIESFGREHLAEFTDGRLILDSGTLAVKAGVPKPLKSGRPLSTAARAELAILLPPAYVRPSCDFVELYGCQDKMVRQLLRSREIEIVRDDKFIIL